SRLPSGSWNCATEPQANSSTSETNSTPRDFNSSTVLRIVGLDRDRRRGASHRRLGLPRCPGPQDQLEVVPLDADGQKPRPVGCRVLNALLQAKDIRVEVERLVLVADEHARVEDLLQHCRSSGGRGHYPMTTG